MDSQKRLLIVGTYTQSLPHVSARGSGIHFLHFDSSDASISHIRILSDVRNPSYLTVSRNGTRLYAVQEIEEEDGASLETFDLDVDARTARLRSSVPALGSCPCHLSLDLDERRLFVSNYGSGSLVVYPVDNDGPVRRNAVKIQRAGFSINLERQKGSHIHQAIPTPDGLHVLVCDAGADEILRYSLDGVSVDPESEFVIKTGPGSLPRHLAFTPGGSGFLVLHELDASIVSYAYEEGSIRPVSRISVVPEGWTGIKYAAAICVHPSGRFAYATNRGHDSIFALDLSAGIAAMRPIGWQSVGGIAPRDITIDPSGRFLIAANQDSHNLSVFSIDQDTGCLTQAGSGIDIGSPVCVHFPANQRQF
jgi:6-phosphogluconolactonase